MSAFHESGDFCLLRAEILKLEVSIRSPLGAKPISWLVGTPTIHEAECTLFARRSEVGAEVLEGCGQTR